ncbi:hypothetical protein [Stappia sp.]|uniref:hypothetical protein n=1 Tax=Stappia sp. TaxID=1870903 RepID=UPI003A993EF1
MGFVEFFASVWVSYLTDLTPAEQVLAALTVLGPVLASLAGMRRYYLGANKNLAVELAEEKDASRRWLKKFNEAEAELASLKRGLPAFWMDVAGKERRDGNEELALGFLRDELRTIAQPLAEAADNLARHHVSMAFDGDPAHLSEARRHARLAVLHGGATPSREGLLSEIDLLAAASGIPTPREFTTWDDLHDAYPGSQDGLPALAALHTATFKQLEDGHYHVAGLINRRAGIIAERIGRPDHPGVLATRYLKARVLNHLGDYQPALAEIDALLPDQKRALPADDPNLLVTWRLKARVLDNLGNHQAALAEVDAVLPLEEAALTQDHPNVLATRRLKARILNNLGEHAAALAEIEAFAPREEKALSPGHPGVLATRRLKAQVMEMMGDHQAVYEELDAIASLEGQNLAPDHPAVLTTRYLKARSLAEQGKDAAALDEIKAVAPPLARVLTQNHPTTQAALRLMAGLLAKAEAADRQASGTDVAGTP